MVISKSIHSEEHFELREAYLALIVVSAHMSAQMQPGTVFTHTANANTPASDTNSSHFGSFDEFTFGRCGCTCLSAINQLLFCTCHMSLSCPFLMP
ncbi:unnamed protein product [Protopolystoma xenopodis]|uniref:Uncharacterized protein n=1 Tax=Protopolystoma xenopodis TaxID=117903 RepID=A0A3S5A343_9PLAT|nr:unnamed protein product [Protopolystoma xenopodis]